MANLYPINNSEGVIVFNIEPGNLNDTDSDLTLYGDGSIHWGERLGENFYRLLEHHACPEKGGSPGNPQDETDLGVSGAGVNNPVPGQIWFNKTDDLLYVYTVGGSWEPLASGTTLTNDFYDKTDSDARFVNESGDAMSGVLDMTGNAIINLPTPTNPDDAATKDYAETVANAAADSAVPPGTISGYGGTVAPAGYFLCNGAFYDPATYPLLFAVVGTSFGGNGVTTFAVPDLRGRFPLGLNDTGSNTNRVNRIEAQSVGGVSGDEDITLTVNEIPAHNHTGSTSTAGNHSHSGSTNTTGNHSHNIELSFREIDGDNSEGDASVLNGAPPAGGVITSNGNHSHTLTINNNGNHSHTLTINNTGSGGAHDNTPPFQTINFIIKYD